MTVRSALADWVDLLYLCIRCRLQVLHIDIQSADRTATATSFSARSVAVIPLARRPCTTKLTACAHSGRGGIPIVICGSPLLCVGSWPRVPCADCGDLGRYGQACHGRRGFSECHAVLHCSGSHRCKLVRGSSAPTARGPLGTDLCTKCACALFRHWSS